MNAARSKSWTHDKDRKVWRKLIEALPRNMGFGSGTSLTLAGFERACHGVEGQFKAESSNATERLQRHWCNLPGKRLRVERYVTMGMSERQGIENVAVYVWWLDDSGRPMRPEIGFWSRKGDGR